MVEKDLIVKNNIKQNVEKSLSQDTSNDMTDDEWIKDGVAVKSEWLKTFDGQALAIRAASENNVSLVKKLIKAGLDVNQADVDSKNTLLHAVAVNGSEDVAKILLKHGANPNLQNIDNYSPLHFAVSNNNTSIAKVLLEYEANPNQGNKYGQTPMHLAVFRGNTSIAKVLLENGANPNQGDNNGISPLDNAKHRGFKEMIQMLSSTKEETETRSLLNSLSEHSKKLQNADANENNVVHNIHDTGR